MTPHSKNAATLVKALRATLAQLEQEDELNAEDLNELKRSILLTIAKLDLREDEPGSDSLADVA